MDIIFTAAKGESMSEYTDQGFKSRRDYLDSLVETYELPRETVYTLAQMLGSSEDFDGLVTALEDAAEEEERAQLWGSALSKEAAK